MLRFAMLMFMLFHVVLVAGCSKPTPYDSATGKFTAEFPGSPKEQSQAMPTPLGTITAYIVGYESRSAAYMVMYADYPQSHVQSTSADEILDGACDGAASNINGRVISKTPITIGNHPGRELRVSATHEGKQVEVRNRVYLVGNRLYQVLVTSAPGGTQDSTANRFVDSFKLK